MSQDYQKRNFYRYNMMVNRLNYEENESKVRQTNHSINSNSCNNIFDHQRTDDSGSRGSSKLKIYDNSNTTRVMSPRQLPPLQHTPKYNSIQ